LRPPRRRAPREALRLQARSPVAQASGQVYQVVAVAGPDKVCRLAAADRGFLVAARVPTEAAGAAGFRFLVVRAPVYIRLSAWASRRPPC
jgi:hypothetical protein